MLRALIPFAGVDPEPVTTADRVLVRVAELSLVDDRARPFGLGSALALRAVASETGDDPRLLNAAIDAADDIEEDSDEAGSTTGPDAVDSDGVDTVPRVDRDRVTVIGPSTPAVDC